ncbi:glutamyl-tRNA amidotransferase [Mycoplasma phocoeninasale]|uniref:Glutamyl-tRNA amidotransferase n=1 Tax=Mycoplasma phocoeninasale TaxID=2726117 RepID=A0A858U273_9MOLU|nr:glutamyl-tRNA amidotransferase [Mycoplasma phocoeninasale]QJG66512.1 glutamyl-tRNA amidotransferase [Mycoplasma phocoeninasale]
MDDKHLKTLANDLLFEPSEEVLSLAKKLLMQIDSGLRELDAIDLSSWKALSHINEKPLSFKDLRKDEINKDFYLNKNDILRNAANRDEEFVIIKKVINEE